MLYLAFALQQSLLPFRQTCPFYKGELFVKRNEEYDKVLGLFAASHELSLTALGNAINIYLQKSEQYLRKVVLWLQKNIWEACDLMKMLDRNQAAFLMKEL